jgi:hypothetical protein
MPFGRNYSLVNTCDFCIFVKMKLRVLIILLCLTQTFFAQKKKSKCKLAFDKYYGIEMYEPVDSITGPNLFESENDSIDFRFMEHFDANGLTKIYPVEQRLEFSYLSHPDGSNTLVKVHTPKDDKEIEAHVKDMIAKMPASKHKCWCNGKVVPGVGSVSMRLYPKTKCKKEFDKELGIEVYTDLDTAARPVSDNAFKEFFNAEVFKDIKTTKKYPDDQMVKISFMIGVDGKASLIKVLEPKNDKEITQEAQIIVNFIPLHKPCKCGNVPVPCNGNINFPLYNKKK